MKEPKAYIRPYNLEATVNALQAAGTPGITVVELHPASYRFEPNQVS